MGRQRGLRGESGPTEVVIEKRQKTVGAPRKMLW
jgi:hypothetical protein